MPVGSPAIAAVGVIGRQDQPLHISTYPAEEERDQLEFEYLLNSSLDIFEARLPYKAADHDFGLLQAIDERLAMYGWLTNTGIKFVLIVDMEGRPHRQGESRLNPALGLRDSDLKPAFRALHQAYIRLLRNPFYDPDDLDPPSARGGAQITSRRFIAEVDRVARNWQPGVNAS